MADETLNCRSILCTPITRELRIDGASVACDALVLDLEDSIAATEKSAARRLLGVRIEAARQISNKPKIIVRINSVRTKEGVEDLIALAGCSAGPDGIHIPKVESLGEVQFVQQFLKHYFANIRLQVIVETARGLSEIPAILRELPYINGVVFGAADFASDIGTNLNWESLKMYRADLIKAAKLNNVHVIDAPFFDYHDAPGLSGEVAKSYDLGFSGKIAIHPSQVATINEGFSPKLSDFLESMEIVNAAMAEGSPIFRFKGRMIGPPIVNCARRVIGTYRQFNGGNRG